MTPARGWIGNLDRNARGRPFLSEWRARELAREAASGKWYTAYYATQWTVGKVGGDEFSSFHILDESGEPLTFETQLEAWQYLRCDLNVPSHAILLMKRH